MLVDVLIAVLVVTTIAAFPRWAYSRSWGFYPSIGIGIILSIVVLLRLGHVI